LKTFVAPWQWFYSYCDNFVIYVLRFSGLLRVAKYEGHVFVTPSDAGCRPDVFGHVITVAVCLYHNTQYSRSRVGSTCSMFGRNFWLEIDVQCKERSRRNTVGGQSRRAIGLLTSGTLCSQEESKYCFFNFALLKFPAPFLLIDVYLIKI
jgi:hypothetical protein